MKMQKSVTASSAAKTWVAFIFGPLCKSISILLDTSDVPVPWFIPAIREQTKNRHCRLFVLAFWRAIDLLVDYPK